MFDLFNLIHKKATYSLALLCKQSNLMPLFTDLEGQIDH